MNDKMKTISAAGLASIAGMAMASMPPDMNPSWRRPNYQESAEHKKLRLKRQKKRHMQRKSRKANRA